MPEPMRFCASLGKCSKAVTIGKPGTVRIAKDRAPIDEDKLNKLMTFLADRLSPGDFEQFQDLVDDVVDDAEETNPSEAMAKDGYSTSTRRTIRRAHRNIALGLDSRPVGRGGASPRLAQDAAQAKSFDERFGTARIGRDLSWSGEPNREAPKPRVAMDAARAKSLDERFGTGRIGHAS